MRYSSISAVGTLTAINGGATDYLRLDPARCSGGGGASLRTVVENKPGVDGVLLFPPLLGSQIITLAGDFVIGSASSESGYMAALDTLENTILTALDALRTSGDTLTHGGGSLTVLLYSPYDSSWSAGVKSCVFGLVVVA